MRAWDQDWWWCRAWLRSCCQQDALTITSTCNINVLCAPMYHTNYRSQLPPTASGLPACMLWSWKCNFPFNVKARWDWELGRGKGCGLLLHSQQGLKNCHAWLCTVKCIHRGPVEFHNPTHTRLKYIQHASCVFLCRGIMENLLLFWEGSPKEERVCPLFFSHGQLRGERERESPSPHYNWEDLWDWVRESPAAFGTCLFLLPGYLIPLPSEDNHCSQIFLHPLFLCLLLSVGTSTSLTRPSLDVSLW